MNQPSTASSPSSASAALWDSLLTEAEQQLSDGTSTFQTYRFNPTAYIQEKLGWHPWSGDDEHPGQREILDAYTLALQQMHERRDYEAGLIKRNALQYWQPGEVIKNWLRVEAGHGVGKTKLSSGLVNHFFDCFPPAIVYTFAPSQQQIKDLLWKEIGTDRRGKGLPGTILEDCQIKYRDNHFAKGKATNDNGGTGTTRVHGQHGPYLMFVIDEAEGVADFVFNAIKAMSSGGIVMVLMLANPQSRTSTFHKLKSKNNVANFRISCLFHPNVLADREIVPGATRREYITEEMREHYERVEQHDPDAHTFELPWQPGVIYRPDPEFLFRVLGIAPSNVSDNTLIPVGRYEGACKRPPVEHDPERATMGVDVARWGKDYGTLYIRHNGRVWRETQFWKQDTIAYKERIKTAALELAEHGVKRLHIRVDGGGGFGGGVIDQLQADAELEKIFTDFQVFEVHFNGTPHDDQAYFDLITEMHGEAAETLKGIAVDHPPDALEADLCERLYEWRNVRGINVKKLQDKDKFKKDHQRSPDDGDGFVLAAAPDHLFSTRVAQGQTLGIWKRR